MDHSNAQLTECSTDPLATKTVEFNLAHQTTSHDAGNGEHQAHNKENQQQSGYYKKLGEVIKGYDAVLLFGPTNAKAELHNLLKADHLFSKIKIDVKQADKMSENQQHAFVKEHFAAARYKTT